MDAEDQDLAPASGLEHKLNRAVQDRSSSEEPRRAAKRLLAEALKTAANRPDCKALMKHGDTKQPVAVIGWCACKGSRESSNEVSANPARRTHPCSATKADSAQIE